MLFNASPVPIWELHQQIGMSFKQKFREFFRHGFGKDGVQVDPETTEVKSYNRNFVPNFVTLARSIHRITDFSSEFRYTTNSKQPFKLMETL